LLLKANKAEGIAACCDRPLQGNTLIGKGVHVGLVVGGSQGSQCWEYPHQHAEIFASGAAFTKNHLNSFTDCFSSCSFSNLDH
jgi:hypothetical protein